jgi:hypothetical protein
MTILWTGTYDINNTPINVGDLVRDANNPNDAAFIVPDLDDFLFLRELHREQFGIPIEAKLVIVGMEE